MSEKFTKGKLQSSGPYLRNQQGDLIADIRNFDDLAQATATRLALCWNSHDELVEALQDMLDVGSEYYDMDCGENGSVVISKAREILSKLNPKESHE